VSTYRVIALAGEPEYDAHHTMRPVLAEIADELDLAVDYRTPSVVPDEPEFPVSSFGGLAALDDADLVRLQKARQPVERVPHVALARSDLPPTDRRCR
jgi:hypothetical protein